MPSVRYYNQTAPFWDFVANLEQQGFSNRRPEGDQQPQEAESSWGWGGPWGNRHRGGFPFRGPPPPAYHDSDESMTDEKNATPNEKEGEAGPSTEKAPKEGEPAEPTNPCEGRARGRHGGCHGRRGRGFGWGARGGPHHHGPHGHGPHGRGSHPWAPFGMHPFLAPFFNQGEEGENREAADFTPDADVFDTETAFVVHVALPGAQKEDVGVNWDAEKSELSVAGVIYRAGDEEFLKTLAMDGISTVGPFEKKIRLGSRATPAQVDADMITAKLENGILRVEVPKLDKEDFVEIKKVDIA